METLLNDLRFGVRTLSKSPGFSALAILTFALGIGVNIAIFSVVDAVALRRLGVADPGRIVRVYNEDPAHPDRGTVSSWLETRQFSTERTAFEAIAGAERRAVIVREDGEPKLLLTNVVSDNYFDVMRVTPAAGRVFVASDLPGAGAPPVAMISYQYWQRRFGGDRAAVGQTLVMTGVDCTIVGVLPREFRGTELFLNPDVYLPVASWLAIVPGDRDAQTRPQSRRVEVFGRLRAGATVAQGAAALAVIQARLRTQFPEQETGRAMDVRLESETRGPQARTAAALLLGVAALVLLIACANVANLLIARGEQRRVEIATRVAIGASRLRTVRQLVTETLLLAVAGFAAALVLGGWVIRMLPSLMPLMPFSVGFDFRLDARATALGGFVAILCALVAGVLPAISASNISPVAVLKDATGGGRSRWRNALVAAQIAVTVLLLVGAGLVARTLVALRESDPGFDQRGNVLIATIASRDMTLREEHAYYRRLIEQVDAWPGVTGVAVASRIPLWESGGGAAIQAWVPDLAVADRDGLRVGFAVVTPQYFTTLGTKILRGRPIATRDDENAPLVAVVNESAARLLWPGQDAIGRRFRVNGATGRELEVVGVAQDGRYSDLTEAQRAYAFLPLYQEAKIFGSRWGAELAVVRTSANAGTQARAIRRAIAEIDSRVLVLGMRTMDDHIRSAMYPDRLIAQLIGSMGALALVLAAIGLFGLVSYSVTRRTREIGLRVALGAHPSDVLRLVFGRTLLLAGIGIAVGLGLALAFGRVFSSVVYGVSTRDPWTFAAAIITMAAASVIAAAWPARRALRLDPIRALRES
jgi:putative ABC transport system permease protein